ncbi:MAG: dTDP-4-dehydrorhamnose 3,5-epimerase family protein [Planctomycetia bacterium]|nr:dTDP-4-dehydrorhamnose 3,5-epimerase family protein [Planctomycetia bacterium]
MNQEIQGVVITPLKKYCDARGWLAETFRQDELPENVVPQMSYLSETLPGVCRGPHEHREQTDIFVFLGPGTFRLSLWDARQDSPTFGNHWVADLGADVPTRVIVPPGVVHGYRCISDVPGWCLNYPDRLYAGWGKTEPVDEIRHENEPDSPYSMA